MDAEEIDKEHAILRAEVAQIQHKELEEKLKRLIEEAFKCGREIDEMKVYIICIPFLIGMLFNA